MKDRTQIDQLLKLNKIIMDTQGLRQRRQKPTNSVKTSCGKTPTEGKLNWLEWLSFSFTSSEEPQNNEELLRRCLYSGFMD